MKFFIILVLLGLQAILVRGDVGTAIVYGPPYTRKSDSSWILACMSEYLMMICWNFLFGHAATKCGGNNSDQFPPGNMFVAVSEGLWDNGGACGRKYRLTCLSGTNRPCKPGTIEVLVVDLCPSRPCSANFLLSRNAFSALSSNSNARLNLEYIQWVCSKRREVSLFFFLVGYGFWYLNLFSCRIWWTCVMRQLYWENERRNHMAEIYYK